MYQKKEKHTSKKTEVRKSMKHVIPQDSTYLPGMKTLMADPTDHLNVRYFPDVEYVRRGEKALHLQLLMPAGVAPGELSGDPEQIQSRRCPWIVYVQGAAWGEQDVYGSLPRLVRMAESGYVVASVKHRASREAGFPAFLQDVKSAIRFLRANAAFYHIDPERVAVWGDSSGGHAALMVGVTGDLPEFKTEDCAEYSDAVNAVLDFYGPTDVPRINDAPRNPVYTADKENIPEDLLFGGCVIDHPEIAQPGNPLNYITAEKDLPPILIVHGDWDSMVPFQQSVLIYKKLMECGKTAEFYKVYGAEHGTCLWTPEVLKTAEQFLGIYLS